jgi:hypothetical protein
MDDIVQQARDHAGVCVAVGREIRRLDTQSYGEDADYLDAAAALLVPLADEVVRLREALGEAKQQIRLTVEQATGIMNDIGRGCNPAERTYGPIIARIETIERRALAGEQGDGHE